MHQELELSEVEAEDTAGVVISSSGTFISRVFQAVARYSDTIERYDRAKIEHQFAQERYQQIYDKQWWERANPEEIGAAVSVVLARYEHDLWAAQAVQRIDQEFYKRYGVTLNNYLGYFEDSRDKERTLQHHQEKLMQGDENISDIEHANALASLSEEEYQKHEVISYQAYTESQEHWDSAEERKIRAEYYDAYLEHETAQSIKIVDQSMGSSPRQMASQKNRGMTLLTQTTQRPIWLRRNISSSMPSTNLRH